MQPLRLARVLFQASRLGTFKWSATYRRLQKPLYFYATRPLSLAVPAPGIDSSPIKSVATDADCLLTVHWSSGDPTEYPLMWLRYNCRCPQCLCPSSHHRLLRYGDLDLNIKPHSIKAADGSMDIVWEGGHESEYPVSWLKDHGFTEKHCADNEINWRVAPRQLWSSRDLQGKIPVEDFEQAMSDDQVLFRYLISLQRFGIALLSGAPTKTGQVHRLADAIGFLKRTHLGTTFQVKADKHPPNLDRSNCALDLHTDLAYYDQAEFLQMLHCIQNAKEGGENQFADGIKVAEDLKVEHPDMFKMLSTIYVYYSDYGMDDIKYNKITRQKVITCSESGDVERIKFNLPIMNCRLDLPARHVPLFFRALKQLRTMLHDSRNLIKHKLMPGEIVTFSNDRVLHGRSEFTFVLGERHLEGAYVDLDESRSKLRVIRNTVP